MESLRSSRRIHAVRAARQRAASATMVVHALGSGNVAPRPRVAVIAGRAIGNAVRRNRAKRRLRAAARTVTLPPVDVVVDARPAVLDAPFEHLPADLERLTAKALRRAGR